MTAYVYYESGISVEYTKKYFTIINIFVIILAMISLVAGRDEACVVFIYFVILYCNPKTNRYICIYALNLLLIACSVAIEYPNVYPNAMLNDMLEYIISILLVFTGAYSNLDRLPTIKSLSLNIIFITIICLVWHYKSKINNKHVMYRMSLYLTPVIYSFVTIEYYTTAIITSTILSTLDFKVLQCMILFCFGKCLSRCTSKQVFILTVILYIVSLYFHHHITDVITYSIITITGFNLIDHLY